MAQKKCFIDVFKSCNVYDFKNCDYQGDVIQY